MDFVETAIILITNFMITFKHNDSAKLYVDKLV